MIKDVSDCGVMVLKVYCLQGGDCSEEPDKALKRLWYMQSSRNEWCRTSAMEQSTHGY